MQRILRHGAFFLVVLAMLWSLPGAGFTQRGGFYYTVRQRESLAAVAGRFGISAGELAAANRIAPNSAPAAGTRLWVPAKRSSSASQRPAAPSRSTRTQPAPRSLNRVYVVRPGDSLWKVGKLFGLSAEALARRNGLDPSAPLTVGQRLNIDATAESRVRDVPGGGIARTYSPRAPSEPATYSGSGLQPSGHGFIWPVEGRVIRRFTKRSDEKYMGIDIAVPQGTEVRAAKDGKVVYSGDTIPFYGKMVIVSHDNGMATCYGQNDRLLVREGQRVKRGQVIARSGFSGRGSDPYLHFEVRRDGEAVNPEPYLP